MARFGRLEILVNNAGAIRGGDFLTTPAEAWADDWRLKILGYVRMAQAAIPVMRTGHWGRIVNIIGAAARNPATTYMAGGIANAGLINFTRALADLGAPDGILVNAVSPGATATERWDRLVAQQAQAQGQSVEALRAEVAGKQPLGRIGRPEDVADLVAVPRLRAGRLSDGGLDHGRRWSEPRRVPLDGNPLDTGPGPRVRSSHSTGLLLSDVLSVRYRPSERRASLGAFLSLPEAAEVGGDRCPPSSS